MINKTKQKAIPVIIIASFLALSGLFLLLLNNKKHGDEMLPVKLAAIQTTNGWGYEIFVDGKMFIKQETLPAVSGERGFKNKEEALAVGNLAVKKLVSGRMPAITTGELRSLKVTE